jgi:putative FmdB family regulatory protein
MPIYEYVCESCGHETEILQSLSEAPAKRCPACSAEALVKQVSAAGFRLKGGGWYETDFKSAGKRNVVDEGAAGAKAEAKSESGEAKSHSCAAGACGCATKTSTAASPAAT